MRDLNVSVASALQQHQYDAKSLKKVEYFRDSVYPKYMYIVNHVML